MLTSCGLRSVQLWHFEAVVLGVVVVVVEVVAVVIVMIIIVLAAVVRDC